MCTNVLSLLLYTSTCTLLRPPHHFFHPLNAASYNFDVTAINQSLNQSSISYSFDNLGSSSTSTSSIYDGSGGGVDGGSGGGVDGGGDGGSD